MNRSMISASVTMGQLQHKLDTISHNIANVNTTGYKERDASFNELLNTAYQNQPYANQEEGRLTPNGIRQGYGAKVGKTDLNLAIGSILNTSRELDVAIKQENQYFQVENEDGLFYTRDGAFYLSPSPTNPNAMMLVNKNGDRVVGANGTINVPKGADEISIKENGDVVVMTPQGANTVGTLALVQMIRPQLLNAEGQNRFSLPNLDDLGVDEADVLQQAAPSLQSHALEMSNVNMQKAMVDMMTMQKAYQFNSRAISMADQMMGLVNNIR